MGRIVLESCPEYGGKWVAAASWPDPTRSACCASFNRMDDVMQSDIEIAQQAKLRPIVDVARELDLTEDDLELYGRYKAKVNATSILAKPKRKGKLVLVTG